jgi:two-component system alkaline phosphatase synthesis response regulator PhoP
MKKVAIVDDFEESCSLMAEILSPYFECEYICEADKALDFLENLKPDLILMDYKMPYMTGVELCKVLKTRDTLKKIPLIFVSGAVSTEERIETLEAGGDDFISKPFHPKELLLRVQKRIETYSSDPSKKNEDIQILTVGNLALNLSSRLVKVNDHDVVLTPKQFDILHLLIKNKSNVVTREEFMNKVWGHSEVTPRNVDSQINYLKKKIEGFNCEITAVPSHGYRLDVKQ